MAVGGWFLLSLGAITFLFFCSHTCTTVSYGVSGLIQLAWDLESGDSLLFSFVLDIIHESACFSLVSLFLMVNSGRFKKLYCHLPPSSALVILMKRCAFLIRVRGSK